MTYDAKELAQYPEIMNKEQLRKCYLIDWLSTEEHNATTRKSRLHIDRLWELQKWSDGQ